MCIYICNRRGVELREGGVEGGWRWVELRDMGGVEGGWRWVELREMVEGRNGIRNPITIPTPHVYLIPICLSCTYVDGVEYQVSGYVVVDVWDHDTLNQNDFLGQVMLPLREVSTTTPHEEWYPLTRRNPKDRVSGSILLEVLLKVDKNKVDELSQLTEWWRGAASRVVGEGQVIPASRVAEWWRLGLSRS